ncbi:hypothetical protein [Asticcacaulis sp. YBE204]|uniref:hypothetical protein n=1 Tax=Asticcacaulis sp. YBE204 TaxID=1282363 RepID=UPI0012DF6E43|nr:hypothetical protein [Asticcacaulis sp. YBE204]
MNTDLKVIVIRPIGYLSAERLIDNLCDRLLATQEVWRFNRLIDIRRFEGELEARDVEKLARQWRSIRGNHRSFAHMAILRLERPYRLYQAGPLSGFPDETICRFSDFQEAMTWLTTDERIGYLKSLKVRAEACEAVSSARRTRNTPTTETEIEFAKIPYDA